MSPGGLVERSIKKITYKPFGLSLSKGSARTANVLLKLVGHGRCSCIN
jgi:hypothetical protein